MLLSLYSRLPVYIIKLTYILIYNKAYKEAKKINKFVYLLILFYYIIALFWLEVQTERHFYLLLIELNYIIKDYIVFITTNKSNNKQIRYQTITNQYQTTDIRKSSTIIVYQIAFICLKRKLSWLQLLLFLEFLRYKLSFLYIQFFLLISNYQIISRFLKDVLQFLLNFQ